jgi:hypothetical protein
VLYELPLSLRVGLLVQDLIEDLGFLKTLGQAVVTVQVRPDTGEIGGQALAAGLVVPYARLGQPALERLGLGPARVDVKGTPSR